MIALDQACYWGLGTQIVKKFYFGIFWADCGVEAAPVQFGWDEVDKPIADQCSIYVHQERDRKIWTYYTEKCCNNHETDVELLEFVFCYVWAEEFQDSGSSDLQSDRKDGEPSKKIADWHDEDGPVMKEAVHNCIGALFTWNSQCSKNSYDLVGKESHNIGGFEIFFISVLVFILFHEGDDNRLNGEGQTAGSSFSNGS